MAVRVTAISDLHGAVEHLEKVSRECDALLVLGDLINVLDYRTMEGILVDIFGREPVAQAAALRSRGRFEEAREVIRRTTGPGEDFRERFTELASNQYQTVFEHLPPHAYVTFGNVDIPDLLKALAPPSLRFLDGEAVRIGSMSFGFVGGGVRTPLNIPGEVDEDEYDAKLERIGPVDVICTHMPPRLPWYTYDVLGKRFEPGSVGLLAFVQEHQPTFALFGHVHQPLVNRGSVGRTEMVNVGHFQGTGRGFSFDVPD